MLAADYRRRRVAETFIGHGHGRVRVSTVLRPGLDDIDPEELRRLHMPRFETMVFGGPEDGAQVTYQDREGAAWGHRLCVNYVRQSVAEAADKRARLRRMHKSYQAAWA